MWRTLLVLIVLTAVSSAADAQERRIDVRIPDDSSVIKRLLAREKLQVAAGTIHLLNVYDDASGIAYGVATIGSRDNAATVAFGYAYSGSERRPVAMFGAEARESRRVKWFAESWLFGADDGLVTFGARLLRERYSTELGLVVPLGTYGFVMPMVNLTWSF